MDIINTEVEAMKKQQSMEQQKKSVRDQIWLLYYNQYLYDHGVITERERNRMKNKINTRKTDRGAR